MSEEELGGYPLENGQPEYSIVHEIGAMSFSGYVIPPEWFDHLQYRSGKPHMNAIMVLADTIYWYRPKRIEDPDTGKVISYRKRFKLDKLQRSYGQYMNRFNMTKKQARDAVQYLEDEGYITRELRSFTLENGTRLSNVMYIEPVIERIKQITYPHYQGTPYALQGTPYPLQDTPSDLQGTPPCPAGQTCTEITTTEISTEISTDDIAASGSSSNNSLSECQKGFLEIFDREAFRNKAQAREILAWEQEYGVRQVLQAAVWIAGKGVEMNKAFASIRTALPDWQDYSASVDDAGSEGKDYQVERPEPVASPTPQAEPLKPIPIPDTDLDAHEVWSHVLKELRMQMTKATFDTWLSGSQVVEVDDGTVTVRVRDEYAVDWLRARWLKPIQRTLSGVVGQGDLDEEFVTGEA